MKILHIANDYSWTKVHRNLFMELDKLGVSQKIFTPLRNINQIGKNSIDFEVGSSEIIYSRRLKTHHKFFFRLKVNRLFADIQRSVNLKEIDLIHATTLFSDGVLALFLFKKYEIPYIVTVRNTDIYTFLKYRPDLSPLGHRVLVNAKKIIFISNANKKAFYNHNLIRGSVRLTEYLNKSSIIYNGVDKFWIENTNFKSKNNKNNILFIGRFDKNKNAIGLISSIIKLKSKIPDLELSLIGGGGKKEKEILDLINNKKWIHFYGIIKNKEKLLQIFQKHKVFSMVSFHETFGLVYIEALTQGLPVLFSKDQGIDGVFKNKIGEAVDPKSQKDIENGLHRLIDNYPMYNPEVIDFSQFDWSIISRVYIKLYESAI